MQRVIVTGGSGFIGTNLVEALVVEGYTVVSIDKVPPKINGHQRYYRQGDVCDEAFLAATMKDFDPHFIVHLAAVTGMDSQDPVDFKENYASAALLCELSNTAPSLKKIVFTSSLLVCRNGYVPSSDIDYCPPNGYGHSKAISEIVVRESNISVAWDIVRPTSIWGPWFSGGYLNFFKMVSKGLFFNLSGDEILKPTSYVGNACYMMMRIMKSDSNRQTYYLADYPQGSVQEWANTIHRAFGNKGKVAVAPLMMLKVISRLGDFFNAVGLSFPLYSSRLTNMLVSQHYPVADTAAVVGVLPYSRQRGVEATVSWIRRTRA
jgi:nucleoside-diphosphate-sugar epimerase